MPTTRRSSTRPSTRRWWRQEERRFSYRAFQAALFITLYRDQPALHDGNQVLTLLMDIDEGFTTWRHRHALMALRMIGRRVGTGARPGSPTSLALQIRAGSSPTSSTWPRSSSPAPPARRSRRSRRHHEVPLRGVNRSQDAIGAF